MPIALVSGPEEKAPPIQPWRVGEPSRSKDWLVISHHLLTSFPHRKFISIHPHQRFELDYRMKGGSVGTEKQG